MRLCCLLAKICKADKAELFSIFNRILNHLEKQKLETAVVERSVLSKAVEECTTQEAGEETADILNVIRLVKCAVPQHIFYSTRKRPVRRRRTSWMSSGWLNAQCRNKYFTHHTGGRRGDGGHLECHQVDWMRSAAANILLTTQEAGEEYRYPIRFVKCAMPHIIPFRDGLQRPWCR